MLFRRVGDEPCDFNLQIMAFGKFHRLIAFGLLGDDMIGGRCRIGEHHRRLALGEEPVGFRPARCRGEDAGLELRPGFGGLVAIDFLDPQEEAQARCRGARVLEDDLFAGGTFDEILEALIGLGLRHLLGVIDHREMRIVIGKESIVGPGDGKRELGSILAMRAEQAGRFRFRREVGIEAQDHIRLGAGAFELEAVEHGDAVGHRHPIERAATVFLEGFLDLGAGAPFGDEAFISIDGQRLPRRGCTRQSAKGQQGEKKLFQINLLFTG